MDEKKIAAFFDVDKTLLVKDSAEIGFKYLWKLRMVSPLFLLKITMLNQFYKRDRLSARAMAEYCLRYYRGRKFQVFLDGVGDYYVNWMKPYLSPAVVAKVREHQAAGHTLVLLSASVRYYLNELAKDLGIEHMLCTRLEIDKDGVCTGRTLGPPMIGEEKKTAAQEFARVHGIDLAASYAYSDHHSDLPLLESVGHPVVVRPTERLRKIARERSWAIMEIS